MKEKRNQYLEILSGSGFEQPARNVLDELAQHSEQEVIPTLACAVAPVLVNYVLWVLERAQEHNKETLYFLSRDGKILCDIARILCKHYNIKIQCKYFYCSRYVLRLQLFQINFPLALQRFCAISEHLSLQAVLLRGGLSQVEQEAVWHDLGVDYFLTDAISKLQLEQLREQLSENAVFRRIILEKSSALYEVFSDYLRQESMDNGNIAIVDSGWSGSMQESLFYILRHNDFPTKGLTGYYFGLTCIPNPKTGAYYSYYFDRRSSFRRFYRFNNNLFECLCSANHGMTIGYHRQEHQVIATLKPCQRSRHIAFLSEICAKFTQHFIVINGVPQQIAIETIHILLFSLMGSPSRAEAEWFGNISFSDDVSEGTLTQLAPQLAAQDLCSFYLTQKISEKFFARPKLPNNTFWAPGSIAQLSYPLPWWRTVDFELLNLLKYLWAKYAGPQ